MGRSAALARARAIRGWLGEHGLALPPAARLGSFLAQLDGGRGAQLRGDGYILVRFRDAVFCRAELPPLAAGPVAITPGETVEVEGVGAVRLEGDFAQPPPGLELRPYQKDAIRAWSQAKGKGILAMATGAGKTLTDEASAMEAAGYAPRMVEGQRDNIKITVAADLQLAGFYLQRQHA